MAIKSYEIELISKINKKLKCQLVVVTLFYQWNDPVWSDDAMQSKSPKICFDSHDDDWRSILLNIWIGWTFQHLKKIMWLRFNAPYIKQTLLYFFSYAENWISKTTTMACISCHFALKALIRGFLWFFGFGNFIFCHFLTAWFSILYIYFKRCVLFSSHH